MFKLNTKIMDVVSSTLITLHQVISEQVKILCAYETERRWLGSVHIAAK
jgi:hypothetical protein